MSQADREKWNRKYRNAEGCDQQPAPAIVAQNGYLPTTGKAIDVAGGQGNHAIWLAQQGLDITLADISSVALEQASQRASQLGVPLETCLIDLEEEPFPIGPWNLILSSLYLYRPLFSDLKAALAPGGTLIVLQPTKTNLLRHQRPPERYLLDDDELPALVNDLEILHYQQGWSATGRHDALVVAQKPAR